MRLLLVLIFSLSFKIYTQDYNLNAYFRGNLKYEDIEFPNKSKYLVLEFSGNWEDNLGNFGDIRCLSSQFTNEKKEIELEAFCRGKNQDKIEFWIKLKRESYEAAGVGKSKYIFGEGQFNILIDKECPYAVQFVEGGGIFKKKCKVTSDDLLKLKSVE